MLKKVIFRTLAAVMLLAETLDLRDPGTQRFAPAGSRAVTRLAEPKHLKVGHG